MGLASLLVPHRSALDAVLAYRLLALLYGALISRLAQLSALLVCHGVQRQHLSIVVTVAVLLLFRSVNIRQRTVIIGIIACFEGMPLTCHCRVFLRRTSCCRHDDDDNKQKYDVSGTQEHGFLNVEVECGMLNVIVLAGC